MNDTHDLTLDDGPLAWALAYGRRGLRIFPVIFGTKEPAIKEWQVKATADLPTIERWFGGEARNIGLACGPQADGHNLVVIDLDRKEHNGVDTWKNLVASHGDRLDPTPVHATPNDGFHIFYEAPADLDLRNSRSKLGPGIDTRGAGGYVLLPASTLLTTDGEIVGRYTPANGSILL